MRGHTNTGINREWADNAIDAYENCDDGDAACFEIAVFEFFGVRGLLNFAADPACLARLFVDLLAKTFLWMFRNNAVYLFIFLGFSELCREKTIGV